MNINKPMAFLFIGRPGCGKGTQVELLKKYLKVHDSREIAYAYAGKELRKLVSEEGLLVHELAKKIMNEGRKQPDFLAIWAWASELILKLDKDMHLIIDGSPRAEVEVIVLDEAFEFFGIDRVSPILIDVSEEETTKRLKGRARHDDTDEGIKNRLEFFRKDVIPAIKYYEEKSKNNIIHVNGCQGIEEVHQEIISKVFGE